MGRFLSDLRSANAYLGTFPTTKCIRYWPRCQPRIEQMFDKAEYLSRNEKKHSEPLAKRPRKSKPIFHRLSKVQQTPSIEQDRSKSPAHPGGKRGFRRGEKKKTRGKKIRPEKDKRHLTRIEHLFAPQSNTCSMSHPPCRVWV